MLLSALVFLFQQQRCGSVSNAWAPEQPPWQQAATCRKADRRQRSSQRVCVCARVYRGRSGVLSACACICLHSCDSGSCLGWRSTCSCFTWAFRHQASRGHGCFLSAMACPCKPAAPSEQKSGGTLAGILAPAPPPALPLPLHTLDGLRSGRQHFRFSSRALLSLSRPGG